MVSIIIILIVVSAAAKAVIDIIQHKYHASIFSNEKLNPQFWNPKESWKNKWGGIDTDTGKLKEKFPGSSTVFVFTTDAWHLFQLVAYNGLGIACYLLALWTRGESISLKDITVILGLTLFKMIFEVCYSKIFRKG